MVDGGLHAGGPRLAARLNAWRASGGDPAASVGIDFGTTGAEPIVRRRS